MILASGSPRRVVLLGELGVPFETVVSDAPETIDSRLGPAAQAVALAERKARAVASQRETGIVLGADTIVVLDGEMLGKPVDEADATRMLRRLSGREHRVVTGIAVVDAGTGSLRTSAVSSIVRFRTLSDEEIDRLRRHRRAAGEGWRLRHPGAWIRSGLRSRRLLHQRRGVAAVRDGATVDRGGHHRQFDLAGLSFAGRRALSAFGLTRDASGRQNRRLASHVVIAANAFRHHRQPHAVEQALFHWQILGG